MRTKRILGSLVAGLAALEVSVAFDIFILGHNRTYDAGAGVAFVFWSALLIPCYLVTGIVASVPVYLYFIPAHPKIRWWQWGSIGSLIFAVCAVIWCLAFRDYRPRTWSDLVLKEAILPGFVLLFALSHAAKKDLRHKPFQEEKVRHEED
jgi:hypothetical protein